MTRKPPDRGDALPIGKIIEKLISGRRPQTDAGMARVFELWPAAFIAENARPAAFKGNVLLVYVSASPWLHQLQFLKADIIARVNAALGEPLVSDIKFKIGPVE